MLYGKIVVELDIFRTTPAWVQRAYVYFVNDDDLVERLIYDIKPVHLATLDNLIGKYHGEETQRRFMEWSADSLAWEEDIARDQGSDDDYEPEPELDGYYHA